MYDHVQALEYGQANQTALVLLAFSMLVLTAVYGLRRRPLAAAPLA
jgi:ABC-type molybdate transport system permease subunit